MDFQRTIRLTIANACLSGASVNGLTTVEAAENESVFEP
jgi:hypothetical protein